MVGRREGWRDWKDRWVDGEIREMGGRMDGWGDGETDCDGCVER